MLSGLRDMFVSNGYTLQTALSNHRLLQPIHLEFITNVVTWQPQMGILVNMVIIEKYLVVLHLNIRRK